MTDRRAHRPRVLILVKGLGLGGVERLLSESIPNLDRDRFEYELAYLTPWKDDVVPEFEEAGIPVRCLEVTSDLSVAAPSRIGALVKQGGYDIVHTHSPLPSAMARIVAGKALVVHTEHSLPDSRNRLTRLANRVTYPLCDLVIAVSDVVGRSVIAAWPRPPAMKVIHGGVDPRAIDGVTAEETAAARAGLGIGPSDLVVGNVAHLRSQKGHETWLRAAGAVLASVPGVTFVIVGREKQEGYQEGLEHLAGELGISDRVRFAGFQPNPYPYLATFDVFLMASEFEGFPISLVEAMALGRPVVATDVGGVAEALGPGRAGLLASAGDHMTLARHVIDLLGSAGARTEMGAAARERARSEFTLSRMVASVEESYEELLARS